jgi:hypothetical protein
MRLPSHETGFDLANSLHPARYRDNAGSRTSGYQSHASFTSGRTSALPSNIQSGSRMRECRTSGSVRVHSNEHPYRNRTGSFAQQMFQNAASSVIIIRRLILRSANN